MGYINESVIYNIYPLGFCGAPKENDFKQEYRLDKIYGWIDHMKSMSVNALVFNPVFESSKHGYDTIDYKKSTVGSVTTNLSKNLQNPSR